MKLCEKGKPESLRPIDIVFPHASESLNIEITTSLSSTAGGWGIFNLSLQINECDHSRCKTCSNGV